MLTRTVSVVACLCLFSVFSRAQEAQDPQELEAFRDLIETEAGDEATSQAEGDLQRLVDQVMTIRLRRDLNLSDRQLDDLARQLGTYKDQLTEHNYTRRLARTELRECLEQGLSEDQIGRKLERLLDQEVAIARLLHEMIDEAKKELSTGQCAKLYLFVGDFGNFMEDLISRAQYISRHGEPPSSSDFATEGGAGERMVVEELVRREMAGPRGAAQDQDMASLFEGLLMARMSQALQLSLEGTVALYRRVGTYKDQLHELKWQIGEARVGLRRTLEEGAPDAAVSERLEDLLLQEEAAAELIGSLVTEAQKDVLLSQSARLYLFVGEFEEYVVRLLQRAEQISDRYQTRATEN